MLMNKEKLEKMGAAEKPPVVFLGGSRRSFYVTHEPYGWGNGMGVRPRLVELTRFFAVERLRDAESRDHMDGMPIEQEKCPGHTIG